MPGEPDRLLGRVRAGTGDDGHPAPCDFDAERDDAVVLLVAQRRRLARRAAGNQPVRALGDLPLDEILKGFLVDLAVPDGGDARNASAEERRVGKECVSTSRSRCSPYL